MPQKSTERYKITVPVETVGLIDVCTELLSERRMVSHTRSDTVHIAIDSVLKAVPTQVKMICRFYIAGRGSEQTVKLRREVKAEVMSLCKKYRTSSKGFLDAVMTIFFRASLAALWKQNPQKYIELRTKYPDLIIRRKTETLPIRKTQHPTITRRRLKLRRDENQMRHHNYLAEFHEYMKQFGGIDKLLNKNIYLSIHEKPIKDSVGKETDIDLPLADNPHRVYYVRLWKRGRGYNLTILSSSPEITTGPSLEPGTVFRLYDIYRNIYWLATPEINN